MIPDTLAGVWLAKASMIINSSMNQLTPMPKLDDRPNWDDGRNEKKKKNLN